MILVIPVSPVDAKQAVTVSKWIVDLGGIPHHRAVIAHAPTVDRADIDAAFNNISKATGNVEVWNLAAVEEHGWPISPNMMWMETVKRIAGPVKDAPHPGWYFFEPDCLPMREGWLDELDREYRLVYRGTPYMGVKWPTIKGRPETGELYQDGFHMAGTGIYPIDLPRHTQLWHQAPVQHDYDDRGTIIRRALPWDVYMQWDIVPRMHHTNLIQHNWCTVNYREVGGEIVCDMVAGKERMATNKPLSPRACVLHGCKDASLMALAYNKLKGVPRGPAHVDRYVPDILERMGVSLAMPRGVVHQMPPVEVPRKEHVVRSEGVTHDEALRAAGLRGPLFEETMGRRPAPRKRRKAA